ncbi:uncharacterized protein LOC18050033 isoform X2 [Citrus clementina]|uniref:uncharacterized protein LOC18050033 isoform X2 n=1 Tax=Citrus clementina TaxID=85681 RepID=UPI000CECF454|nr:uncharacterized protein LOC18050033 isoform X2 [Citrus x clementina]
MLLTTLLICIAELIYTCQKQKVKWSWIITLPWLYHSRNFKDFIGPVARQHADSSIKMRTNHLKSILAVDDSRTRAQTVPASIAARPANYPFRTEPRSRAVNSKHHIYGSSSNCEDSSCAY